MKAIAIIFAVAGSAVCAWVALWELASPDPGIVQLGSLVVMTLTLVVLVWYAYDTNAIARVTRDRWAREGILATSYEVSMPGASVGDSGRTLVRLTNASPLVVYARVNFNFTVYGQSVSAGALYDGSERWLVFPHQMSQGWFEVQGLLKQAGRDIAAMQEEASDEKCREQLTAVLELEFEDEFGVKRSLPPRRHYFDFRRWAWIPSLGAKSFVRPPA